METELPPDFSGLVYQPSAETGVYLLLGLLKDHLPHRFAYEVFEVDPKKYDYSHEKWLDIKGKVWKDGKWQDASFELKLFSSGLLHDVKKYPTLNFDYLICWIHDCPGVEKYCREVIALKDIYDRLPQEEREKIIFDTKTIVKGISQKTLDELKTRFSDKNMEKVNYILTNIRYPIVPGSAEIKVGGQTTIFRVCSYTDEWIIVSRYPRGKSKEFFMERFKAKELQTEQTKIFLNDMSLDDVKEFVEIFNNF